MTIRFPVSTKLLCVILSVSILAVSLPLSVLAFNDGNGIPDKGESGKLDGNEILKSGLPLFDVPEVVPLSELEDHSIVSRMRGEEQSLCDVIFANDDGSRTSFLFGTPVKYTTLDGTVRDKSLYIADLTQEPENGYVGRMEEELADNVKNEMFSSLEEAFDGRITEEDIRYATLDNDIHTLYGGTSNTGVFVGRDGCFIRMIPSGETGEVSLSKSFSLSDGEEKELVSYPNVFGEDSILQYNPTLHGIKEDIVLQEPTDQTVFSFLVETAGITLIVENGTIQFFDEQTNKSIGQFGEILVLDSAGNLSCGTIAVTETEEENWHRITITVNPEFLQNAVYPVDIDPTVYLDPNGTDYINGNYTFIEDVSIYDDIDVQGYTFIEWHQIGEVMSTGYYGQAAFRFPALYDTTQPSGYSNLTPGQISSFKLHLKSTSGTSSTNVLRASTYVPTWPNTFKIFSSAYFNYFNITSNDVTINSVPVNNTFEIDLTGMARYWKNIQYGLELGNYGTPETGVLLWNYGNAGTIWLESVEYSSNIYAVLDYSLIPSGSVYLNNKKSGEFLGHFVGSLEHISGHVDNIGEEIGWIIESVGIDVYTIKENTPDGQYLSFQPLYGSTFGPVLSNTPANWNISVAQGGGYYIKLAGYTDKYLAIDGNALVLNGYLPNNQKCWRMVGSVIYEDNELDSVTANNLVIEVGDSILPSLVLSTNAYWISNQDFKCLPMQGSQYIALDDSTNVVSGVTPGEATIKVTHKVTGEFDTFTITVKTNYRYELQNTFGFSYDEAELIYSLYQRVDQAFPNESNLQRAWKCARLLSMFQYGDALWNSSVGEVVTISDAQAFFVETLGFTLDEYESLSSCLTENPVALFDFPHMQAALVGRLAYSLGIGLAGLDEEVSYSCGWLGDATLPQANLTTSIPNGDYCADLDAENIYRLIINYNFSSVQASSIYYQSLTNQTRATVFLTYINFDCVKTNIFSVLVDIELFELYYSAINQGDGINTQLLFNLINDEPYHWTVIRSRYPDTYDFLMSLMDELSLITHYQ